MSIRARWPTSPTSRRGGCPDRVVTSPTPRPVARDSERSMRTWGTSPLKNDAAQDLIADLEPLSGDARVRAVRDVFAAYDAYDRRRQAAGAAPRPDTDDGSDQAMRAIGAAWFVAAALARVERPARPALLAGESREVLNELADAARGTLAAILADPALAAVWHHHAGGWTHDVRRLHAALAPGAPTVPPGTGEYEDLDDPQTLARHDRQYRAKMLLVFAAIGVAVYLFR